MSNQSRVPDTFQLAAFSDARRLERLDFSINIQVFNGRIYSDSLASTILFLKGV
jgi:hypothetical protein